MQLWLKILVFVVLWLILVSLLTFYMSIRPAKMITNLLPSDFSLKYEEVTFKSTDGINLSGWFLPNNKTKSAIIVMHGYPAEKGDLLGIAIFLSKDFNVFLFDFRYFGKSEGSYTTAGYLEKNDLLGAIEYLQKEKNITKIGLYGFSLGGAVALSANHQNVRAIVTDSTYSKLSSMIERSYRVLFIFKYPLTYLTKFYGKLFLGIDIGEASPVDSIKNAKVPILLIHAEKDSEIPLKEAYLLKEANPKAELWIIKNADHGMSYASNVGKYEEKVIGFFEENLG